jgi:hypothetical protein
VVSSGREPSKVLRKVSKLLGLGKFPAPPQQLEAIAIKAFLSALTSNARI